MKSVWIALVSICIIMIILIIVVVIVYYAMKRLQRCREKRVYNVTETRGEENETNV